MKNCDMCGKDFKGKSYPVYNENWRKQNVVSCGCHLWIPLSVYDDYKNSGYTHKDIQQNQNLINNSDL